jgi:hypothetical protein
MSQGGTWLAIEAGEIPSQREKEYFYGDNI